jgi:hypothetical protein
MSNNALNNRVTDNSFTVTRTSAATPVISSAQHTSNTAGSDAKHRAEVAGAAGGDPFFETAVGATRAWAIGCDNSAAQRLKITTDTAASVTPSTGTLLATFDPATFALWLTSLSFDSGTNLMGAYVEFGTWTPVIAGATVAGAGTYTTQVGRYSQVGKTIYVTCEVVWTAHTGTGNMLLTGLPQTVRTLASYTPLASLNTINIDWPAGTDGIVGQLTQNTTQMELIAMRDNNTNLNIAMDAAGTVRMSGTYVTN